MTIPNPVTLKFDPIKDIKYGITKRIFKDELAKIFYLAFKSTYKVGEGFGQDCLNASEHIRIYCMPDSPEQLEEIIVNKYFRKKGTPKYSKEFIDDLFLYVDGKKTLEYVVNSRK